MSAWMRYAKAYRRFGKGKQQSEKGTKTDVRITTANGDIFAKRRIMLMGFSTYSHSAELRVPSIRSQLRAAFTVCSTAKTALALHDVSFAREALKKAKRTCDWVRVHLNEPNHVLTDAIAKLAEELAALEQQIWVLETKVRQECDK